MHAAGVVIGEKPLIEIIPLTREPKEKLIVVQFEKGPTEEIGLLKMDFLGLKNLTTIYEACALIKRNYGIALDPEANQRGGPCITTPGSAVSAWVIPTDEERMIAMHTLDALNRAPAVAAAG